MENENIDTNCYKVIHGQSKKLMNFVYQRISKTKSKHKKNSRIWEVLASV